MKPKVYIETSIPSFYYEIRTEPEIIARRNWTHQWWNDYQQNYEIVSSDAVVDELNKGDYPTKASALEFVNKLPLLPFEEDISEIVQNYIQHKLMPKDPLGDALHLALTSYHKCDFLLTWNCRNLANANKFVPIKHINTLLGLYVPTLVTPLELIGV